MLRYVKGKWAENNDKLKKAIEETPRNLKDKWTYADIVKLVVDYILNPGMQVKEWYYNEDEDFWSNKIQTIDDGDYQGTMIFLIHRNCYQPQQYDYLITYVNYGSCSGCDTLYGIQYDEAYEHKDTIEEYMTLCRDIAMNIKHPFNTYVEMEEVEMEAEK